jgi:hypothetical protein
MGEPKGVKETTELLVALGGVSVAVALAVRAGGSPADIAGRIAARLMANPALLDGLKAAFDGISEVPAEIKDLSLGEILELCEVSLTTTRQALQALNTPV